MDMLSNGHKTEDYFNNRLFLTKESMLIMGLEHSKTEVFNSITKSVVKTFEADGSAIYLFNPELEELTLVVAHNLRKELIGVKVKADQGLLGQVVKNLKAMKIDDYREWPERVKVFEEDNYRALLEAPMIWKKDLLGVIGLVRTGNAKPFDTFDLNLLSIMAIHIAATIANLES
jgi:signal transduction protein with GAF and PtsI domain